MSCHVNMMDDTLIQQLPTHLLRSSLRALISQGTTAQKTFIDHVRTALRQPKKDYGPPEVLFDGPCNPTFPEPFWAEARCLFSSKMVEESLPYLAHLLRGIPLGEVTWTPNSPLKTHLEYACGDIVQAIQALKESNPQPTENLRDLLSSLEHALEDCRAYCLSCGMICPFSRARFQVTDALNLLFPQISCRPNGADSLTRIHVHEDISVTSCLQYVQLGNLRVPRLFNGLWQMSSPAWGSASSESQDAALIELVQHGLVATDMADHYGDAELIYGAFRNRLADPTLRQNVIAATKWCIFRPLGHPITHEFVLEAVQERTRRLGGRVELLQFHWYDYSQKDYLKVLVELVKITKTHPHLVSAIGLCNFDSDYTQEACEHLLSTLGEVGIVSNQVQFSLIDCRPLMKMVNVCQRYNIKLLAYGSFCGGFLSDKWLGKERPDIYCPSVGLTPSQRKYFDMINQWGSWGELQSLLSILQRIAVNHNVDVSNVATRWVLDHAQVGAVLVGTRLGVSSNVQSNTKVFSFTLLPGEKAAIDAFVCGTRVSSLFDKIGDCGHEYQKK